MRTMLVMMLVGAMACGGEPKGDSGAADTSDTLGYTTPTTAAPVSLTEVAPGDTATILRVMRGTMTDVDALLPELERRDTMLEPVGTQEPRRLTVWVQNGSPRKLTVTEPDDAGAMTGLSHFWLVGNELRVVQQPFAAYVFYGDRILVWTDSALEPVPDIPDDDRMAREIALVQEARGYLEVFGLRLP